MAACKLKRTSACLVALSLALTLMSCGGASGPVSQQSAWTVETLQPGITIAFPRGYEGDGFRCGIDACYFAKFRVDRAVTFSFPVSGMTGYDAATFEELPEVFRYNRRELIETTTGLSGALYFTPEDEHEYDSALGTFVLEEQDGQGFREVVWVTYASSEQGEVREILRTIGYEGAPGE